MPRDKFLATNYRTYNLKEPLCGSRTGSGLIIADLLNDDGSFYRSAVIADCGNEAGAKKWLKENEEKSNGQ